MVIGWGRTKKGKLTMIDDWAKLEMMNEHYSYDGDDGDYGDEGGGGGL